MSRRVSYFFQLGMYMVAVRTGHFLVLRKQLDCNFQIIFVQVVQIEASMHQFIQFIITLAITIQTLLIQLVYCTRA